MGETDHDGKLILKPVIREMVRTRFTPPNIILLVDKIIIMRTTFSDDDTVSKGAYRMYLTDNQKSIQAVFKRRMHKQVASLEIREGSYISLKEYVLTTGKRLNGKGNVQYLIISDFSWAGEEQRSQEIEEIECENFIARDPKAESCLAVRGDIGEDGQARPGVGAIDDGKELGSVPMRADETVCPTEENASRAFNQDCGKNIIKPKESVQLNKVPEQSKVTSKPEQKSNHENTAASDELDNNKKSTTMNDEVLRKRKRALSSDPSNDPLNPPHSPRTRGLSSPLPKAPKTVVHGASYFKEATDATAQSYKQLSSWALKALEAGAPLQPITRSLKLSTLDSVTGFHRSRNKVVDVLAIVESVDSSTTKPAQLPLKRDARLIDASTDRVVTLSIFVDPVNHILPVGAIILFRNLVTHEYRGGALNAYPHYCEGKDWCIPNPQVGHYPGLEKEEGLRILLELQDKKKGMG